MDYLRSAIKRLLEIKGKRNNTEKDPIEESNNPWGHWYYYYNDVDKCSEFSCCLLVPKNFEDLKGNWYFLKIKKVGKDQIKELSFEEINFFTPISFTTYSQWEKFSPVQSNLDWVKGKIKEALEFNSSNIKHCGLE